MDSTHSTSPSPDKSSEGDAVSSHFGGKSLLEHLTEARKKGALAQAEAHGTEPAGALSAGADSLKESALLLGLLFFLLPLFSVILRPSFFLSLGVGWTLWKTGRSALLGWRRLARLHKAIEEERWEIEHHREEEKEELALLYAAKGFSGKILDQIVTTLMSDDNRLLHVMLEEELGLSLEVHQHPLKQALGAFIGAAVACSVLALSFAWLPQHAFPWVALALVGIGAYCSALWEKTQRKLQNTIWTLSLAIFAAATALFFTQWILQ